MALFGKKRVHEVDAAQQFLQQVRGDIFSNWPAICQNFSKSAAQEPGKPTFSTCADNAAATFEFYLAVVAMQMRAITNLLPNDQAARIRRYIDGYLDAIPADTLQSLLLPSELYIPLSSEIFVEDAAVTT